MLHQRSYRHGWLLNKFQLCHGIVVIVVVCLKSLTTHSRAAAAPSTYIIARCFDGWEMRDIILSNIPALPIWLIVVYHISKSNTWQYKQQNNRLAEFGSCFVLRSSWCRQEYRMGESQRRAGETKQTKTTRVKTNGKKAVQYSLFWQCRGRREAASAQRMRSVVVRKAREEKGAVAVGCLCRRGRGWWEAAATTWAGNDCDSSAVMACLCLSRDWTFTQSHRCCGRHGSDYDCSDGVGSVCLLIEPTKRLEVRVSWHSLPRRISTRFYGRWFCPKHG